MLRRGRTKRYIDPEKTEVEWKDSEPEVQRLMTVPKCWSMVTKEQAVELREILRHFSLFVPFEGRPFVRFWLEALLPCLSRWILLSDSTDEVLTKTLKNFLGAFGQPGIVVCLADKGASMLETLKRAARSVEAVGRGKVERYYWKRLLESSCGGGEEWRQLASIDQKPLEVSQLDYLPHDWLLDSSDWGVVFANFVSPELSKRFRKKIDDIFSTKELYDICPGPPKTVARTLAKSREYLADFSNQKDLPRWLRFAKKFRENFHRDPNQSTDFVWNIVDFARCSITVPGAPEVLEAKRLIQEHFKVVCIKNGYNSEVRVKGSGYRDLKLLIEVEFNGLELDGVAKVQPKTTLICEVQILCEAWLENKKTTSMSYKILRAQSLCDLLYDAAKYSNMRGTESRTPNTDAIASIKNGWLNIAKAADYSDYNADELLLTAAYEGWSAAGVNILVQDLNANMEVRGEHRQTPLILACRRGSVPVVKLLIELGSNIESKTDYNSTALIIAAAKGHESCVRCLLASGARLDWKDDGGETALDTARNTLRIDGSNKNRRIVKLLEGETVISMNECGFEQKKSPFEEIQKVAIEGSLERFFDVKEVSHSLVSQALNTIATVASLKNLMQTLWFGGNVQTKNKVNCWTPLHNAVYYGTSNTVSVLLKAGAPLEARALEGETPLMLAA